MQLLTRHMNVQKQDLQRMRNQIDFLTIKLKMLTFHRAISNTRIKTLEYIVYLHD